MLSDNKAKDIVYGIIKESSLSTFVTGKICKRKRPKDSDKEDISIAVVSNLFAQRQMVYINLNIYVKDKQVNNQSEEDSVRIEEICEEVISLFDGYTFEGGRIDIQAQPIEELAATSEHIINTQLILQYIN